MLMLGIVFLCFGCVSIRTEPMSGEGHSWVTPPDSLDLSDRKQLAVVFSAGAQRAYAHIGVVRAFEKAGVVPNIIVGSSAGAIVGALWASGMKSSDMENLIGLLETDVYSDWKEILYAIMQGRFKGFTSGNAIEHFIRQHVINRNIEDLPIRFAVVTTDLNTGTAVRINVGSLARAVRASAGVPVVMRPVSLIVNDKLLELIDGGLTEPIPIKTARLLGAQTVVAVDVGYRPSEAVITNPLDVAFQSIQISISSLRTMQLLNADLVITPRIHEQNVTLKKATELINEGERAAEVAIRDLGYQIR